jgi:RNA polymerase sigma factor (sigma-70 family)
MNYTYKTATGEAITIEVDQDWVTILEGCDHQEHLNNRRESRRHYHWEACQYEGTDFVSSDDVFDRFLESDAARAAIQEALPKLSKPQRQLVEAVYLQGFTPTEYSQLQGISKSAVSQTKAAALKKLKKILVEP